MVGFRIPDGTSTTFTIAASVQSWTTVEVHQSAGEQALLVAGAPSTQRGQHSGTPLRTRAVDLVKVAAHDTAHTPVPGYRFEISDAGGHLVLPSVTTGTAAADAPLGALTVGATYHAHELSAPPGAKLYMPVEATTSFVVPPGTGTWTIVASDPEVPTPTIVTRVSLSNAIAGQPLVDTITVSGDDGENGTIDATLYGPLTPPASGTCGDLTLAQYTAAPTLHVAVHVDGSVNGGNGTVRAIGPIPAAAGCWGWGEILTLSPSAATASSLPTAADESTLVTAPQVVTTASAQIGGLGTQLTDAVQVTGMNGQRGTLTATLFGPLPADPRTGCRQYDESAWAAATAKAGQCARRGCSHRRGPRRRHLRDASRPTGTRWLLHLPRGADSRGDAVGAGRDSARSR